MYETFNLPKEPFDVVTLQAIYNKCKRALDDDEPLSTSYKKLTDYIFTYYYETRKGQYYFYNQPKQEFLRL